MGYRPGFKPGQLKGAKLLYLLGAVSEMCCRVHVAAILISQWELLYTFSWKVTGKEGREEWRDVQHRKYVCGFYNPRQREIMIYQELIDCLRR